MDKMDQLKQYASQAETLYDAINSEEENLKDLKQRYRDITEESIPNLMDAVGIKKMETDGFEYEKKLVVTGSFPADPELVEAAMEHLRELGAEALFRPILTATWKKGQKASADWAKQMLTTSMNVMDHPSKAEVKETVHAQTLRAFARECLEDGTPIDFATLGLDLRYVAKIKERK